MGSNLSDRESRTRRNLMERQAERIAGKAVQGATGRTTALLSTMSAPIAPLYTASRIRAASPPPRMARDAVDGAGRPLPQHVLRNMNSRLGHDFSRVRIHTDGRPAQVAQAIRARAITIGDHVAFAPGQYAPDSSQGRHLIAHELVHTWQQAHLPPGAPAILQASWWDDAREAKGPGAASRKGMTTQPGTPPNPRVDKCYDTFDADAYWNSVDELRRRGVSIDEGAARQLFDYLTEHPPEAESMWPARSEGPAMSRPSGTTWPGSSVQRSIFEGKGFPPGIYTLGEAYVQHQYELSQWKKQLKSQSVEVGEFFLARHLESLVAFARETAETTLRIRYFRVVYAEHDAPAATIRVTERIMSEMDVRDLLARSKNPNRPNYWFAGIFDYTTEDTVVHRAVDDLIARVRMNSRLSYMLVNPEYRMSEEDYRRAGGRLYRPPLTEWPRGAAPMRQEPAVGTSSVRPRRYLSPPRRGVR
ncbi:protein of unknown function [Geodermatophilus obscurus]|uniref:eCIS core domain-containing protein n=1 Tax=Geodermatophilus obscurus TaxID=1861 RepID=A0A1M7S3R0_9ACTN|nr:protein of unknown function [Geodermatophilus obscurus]